MIKFIIQLLSGITIIVGTLWYLAGQFTSIDVQLTQVISTDIPKIKNDLESNYEKTEQIRTNMDNIARTIDALGDQSESIDKIEINMNLLSDKIDDEIISEMNQLELERDRNIKEVEILSRKIDNLSIQYVKFLKLSKDKITVSIPPKWVDELPCRDGMIFNVGVSPSTKRINEAQQLAVKQARSHMEIILKRKTINAIGSTIEAAGKLPPSAFDELSEQFKEQVNEAISELMRYSKIESYWVDPAGYIYALVSLPVKNIIEGSKFGVLIETLELTYHSSTEALTQDFKHQLKVELLN
jgi:hypothetical protein